MWWKREPFRLIQTNLREIDTDLDPERLVADVVETGGTVLLFNCGGIVANYPTALEFHYRNPYLRGDLVGDVLRECKKRGIRFIGRFDFSKANEVYLARHPEWFYRRLDGQVVNYNGQIHTCVNGPYQQECSLEILKEALQRYPMDGVFFNMFGYQTRDYSGNYHGICQCENCREAFWKYARKPLPRVEDQDDPIFRVYQQFQRETVNALLDRIYELVKSFGDHVAICTYATHRVDIVRSESNSAVDRPLPDFIYSASENTRFITASWPDKIPSNSAVHFVDIPYRYVGVSPHLTELRLAQTIANGGGPDYYVISTLDRQWDRAARQVVSSWFEFHRRHQTTYRDMRPAGSVALLAFNRHSFEYHGLFTMLAEEHLLFHNLDPVILGARPDALRQYDAVIVPGPVALDEKTARELDNYVKNGGKLIVTQEVKSHSPSDKRHMPLESVGVSEIIEVVPSVRSAYFTLAPQELFNEIADLDLCFVDGPYRRVALSGDAVPAMPLIPPHMYGPPEKCYYTVVSDEPGLIIHQYGKGQAIYFPWNLGALYYRLRWPGYRRLLAHVMDVVLGVPRPLKTNAPDRVEVVVLTHDGTLSRTERHWLLQLINVSGQGGAGYYAPLPIYEIDVSLTVPARPSSTEFLDHGKSQSEFDDGVLRLHIPRIDVLTGVVINW